jgi:hypothetical protein
MATKIRSERRARSEGDDAHRQEAGDRGDREPRHDGDSDAIEAIARQLRAGRLILFVGSGVSAGLGLPSWEEFIGSLGKDLGYREDEFLGLSADFRALAEYYRLQKGSIESLRSRMIREWDIDDEVLRRSEVHRLVARLGFPLIYTTNYDHLLERAFELRGLAYSRIVTAKDIPLADASAPMIVKFHGDLDEPDSMILAETDYFGRLLFEGPLDIRLTADAFERAVLFIGYSLSDVNLRYMLYRLRAIWLRSGYERAQPRSFVFMPKPNVVQERILDSWGITAIVGSEGREDAALRVFMQRLAHASERDESRDGERQPPRGRARAPA